MSSQSVDAITVLYILCRASLNCLLLYYSIALTAFSRKKDTGRLCRKRANMPALLPLQEHFSRPSENFQIYLQ